MEQTKYNSYIILEESKMVTIKDFAKLLNVEFGEEFLLANEGGTYTQRYRFTENGVEYLSSDGR